MGKILDIPGFGVVTDKDVGETTMFKSSRQDFENEAERMNCSQYTPCPVCYKCMNKSGHMYEQCERCFIPLCHHNENSRKKLIRPNNFTLVAKGKLLEDLEQDLKEYRILKSNGFKKKLEEEQEDGTRCEKTENEYQDAEGI